MDACLNECGGCGRHLRESEEACPFCGAAIIDATTRPRPSRRLSRRGMMAFGAATATTMAIGCGGGTDTDAGSSDVDSGIDEGGTDAGSMDVDSGGGGDDAGFDAGPVSDDAGFDAGFDAGNIAMPYGAPPIRDAWV